MAVGQRRNRGLVTGVMLVETLRRKLNNDFFDFSIALDESAAPTTAWSDREVLNHMVESSPYMAQFINDLKFTLS